MGNYKTYCVMKNGENLKTVRSLQTAKELAEQAGAEVVCDGECIYKANVGERYIITSLMNVRSFPGGEILGTAPAGTVVEVYELKDDWLRVNWKDGFAYIQYGNGQFAGRV